MSVERVRKDHLRGWTDGPKVVLDYFSFWTVEDFKDCPDTVHVLQINQRAGSPFFVDVPATIAEYSPYATYYVTGYKYVIERLANMFPNIKFYDLEDELDE